MARKLTAEIARELIEHDPKTGLMTWKNRDRKWFDDDTNWRRWNTRYEGSPAFDTKLTGGAKGGFILGEKYAAHHVVWLMTYGVLPGEIRHINGDRSDNRPENLKLPEIPEPVIERRQRIVVRNKKDGSLCAVEVANIRIAERPLDELNRNLFPKTSAGERFIGRGNAHIERA